MCSTTTSPCPKTLTRRAALLAAMALPLGSMLAVKLSAQAPAHLRVPLDQWAGITFEHGKQRITFTGAEIFRILAGK